MIHDCKTVYSGDYVYRLSYKLTNIKGNFFVTIMSEKFKKDVFLSEGDSPLAEESEESTEKLIGMNKLEANKLFQELKENLVFPCSLTYILEDIGCL